MGKRKSHSVVPPEYKTPALIPQPNGEPPRKQRVSQRKVSQQKSLPQVVDPDQNANVLDGAEAWRASPDADERMDVEHMGMNAGKQIQEEDERTRLLLENGTDSGSSLSELSDVEESRKTGDMKSRRVAARASDVAPGQEKSGKGLGPDAAGQSKVATQPPQFLDPEKDGDEEPDEEELQAAFSRPPPVNSGYLPLPWKGRLGYACLCTYLRSSNPPVFSSRTCRIASILENRHPLKDPDEPPHATKNRPDRDQPASIARGQSFVESLGLANARDIPKMLRWNDRYGIKFMRLSSEMFPFASHEEYGYKLAPFAAEVLADAGRVAAELGHRLTTHPGQFTQLGSPRNQVIENAIRDLEYHAELLSLLKLPPQQDRDAVMILHLGGAFGDKATTLDRFRENYKRRLSQGIKDRLVLENDDVSWSVHDLLPLCEELNIPLVLDFHHHNIIFEADKIREGTKDIMELYPRILATWERKNITPKMHYSEPTPSAITGKQRRKHNSRVACLPPCPPTMDLMIEAKDKEQAVFELMRTYKLPGFDSIHDMIPHVRQDENKSVRITNKKPVGKKSKKPKTGDDDEKDFELLNDNQDSTEAIISDDQIGMGGPEGRVYWPPGMEHWLRPVKKVVKPKTSPITRDDGNASATPKAKKRKGATEASRAAAKLKTELQQQTGAVEDNNKATTQTVIATKNTKTRKQSQKRSGKKMPKRITSDDDKGDNDDKEKQEEDTNDQDSKGAGEPIEKSAKPPTRQRSMRAKKKKTGYAEYQQGNIEGEK